MIITTIIVVTEIIIIITIITAIFNIIKKNTYQLKHKSCKHAMTLSLLWKKCKWRAGVHISVPLSGSPGAGTHADTLHVSVTLCGFQVENFLLRGFIIPAIFPLSRYATCPEFLKVLQTVSNHK